MFHPIARGPPTPSDHLTVLQCQHHRFHDRLTRPSYPFELNIPLLWDVRHYEIALIAEGLAS